MTFRKRLLVAFFTVIMVPMLLFAVSFIALGNYLVGEGGELEGYTSIVENYDDYDEEAEQLYQSALQNRDKFQDVEYLDWLASQIKGRNIYIAVRRGGDLYFASDEQMAFADFAELPPFQGEATGTAAALSAAESDAPDMDGAQDVPSPDALDMDGAQDVPSSDALDMDGTQDVPSSDALDMDRVRDDPSPDALNRVLDNPEAAGVRINGTSSSSQDSQFVHVGSRNLMVRQKDFYFADGAEGSLFVVTRITGLISRQFLSGLFVAMLTILIFTAFLLTRWLESSVFTPISAINIAMNNIRDGNFTYTLSTGEEGEIGDLYRNYEDMRLRLKESADEKLEREKQNRELISNISHDLKTPITSIKGYVEGLIDGVANTPEKQKKYVRTIYNKANDMDRLIDELTLYARFENDRIPYNFHRLNVADYFGDCVEEIGMDLDSRGFELNYTNLVSPQTVIIADPEQMKRVVNNIVGNSLKYMDKEKGRIDFRILDEQDSIRIEIEDNGQGIAARDLPNIFDRFYRTDSSRNSSRGGSGIGLSIVRAIINGHGRSCGVTNTEDGPVFWFELEVCESS